MPRALVLLSLLLLSDSHAQAVVPPPRPPLVRPVVNEPYFPTPGATPEGAGLPGERVPGARVEPVKPSPNKSVKAVGAGPELWAADGAPRASADKLPAIFGIAFPYPPSATVPDARRWSDLCGTTMDNTAKQGGADAAFSKYPAHIRMCLAAEAYLYCAKGLDRLFRDLSGGKVLAKADARAVLDMEAHARMLVSFNCRHRDQTDPLEPSLLALYAEWEAAVRAGATPKPTP